MSKLGIDTLGFLLRFPLWTGTALAKTIAPSPVPLMLSLRKVVNTPVFTPMDDAYECECGLCHVRIKEKTIPCI